jgi:hypothetical protein
MKHAFLAWACAAAAGALTLSAHAQYGGAPVAGAPMTPSATPTQVDADYGRNVARCDRLAGAARADCLRKAKADYDRAVNQLPSGLGASGGGGNLEHGNVKARD